MLDRIRDFRLYALVVLLAYGGFVWAGLHGYAVLGDDNETTENINGTGGHSSGHAGRASYFHK